MPRSPCLTHMFLGDGKASQLRDIISPAFPWFSSGPRPSYTCPKYHIERNSAGSCNIFWLWTTVLNLGVGANSMMNLQNTCSWVGQTATYTYYSREDRLVHWFPTMTKAVLLTLSKVQPKKKLSRPAPCSNWNELSHPPLNLSSNLPYRPLKLTKLN